MNPQMAQHTFPPFRIQAERARAAQFAAALGIEPRAQVPATYMIFLRGENLGVDLFRTLGIPRQKALLGGQRYEWLAPIGFDDELEVQARVESISEKQGKRGRIWFADVSFEYRRVRDRALVLREVTRLIEQS
jgi:hypothetical protein